MAFFYFLTGEAPAGPVGPDATKKTPVLVRGAWPEGCVLEKEQ